MNTELLYRFFEGLTTIDEEKAIRAWMEESPENKKLFIEERKIFDAMLLLKSEEEMTKILSDKTKISMPEPKKYSLYKELLKIASVLIITLIGGWFYMQTKEDKKLVEMQTISVPAGQRINITLPDGTNVWLNARTTIQYPVTFNRKERNIKLTGQAYFDVSHDEGKPFVVQTDKGKISVLGTKFDVMAYNDNELFETALMEGSVKINLASDPTHSITLIPGTKSYIENGKLEVKQLGDLNIYRWKEGLICFNNSSFGQMMKEFEKSYGMMIVVHNQQIKELSYTGKFRINDGFDYAMRVLQKDINFIYDRDDENNIIYIR